MTTRRRRLFTAVFLAGLCLLVGGERPAPAATALTFVRSMALPGKAHDIVIVPPHVFVATDTGMTILNISGPVSPDAPIVVRSIAVGGSPTTKTQGLAVQGSRVYLASQAAGVQVVDISNIGNPRIVGAKTLPTPVWDVAVKGNLVYAVTFGGELYVLDASNDSPAAEGHRPPGLEQSRARCGLAQEAQRARSSG